jgi:DNA polymerase alpha-associated DNA helicase A
MANNITYQRMKDTMMNLINRENHQVVRILMNASKPTFGDLVSDLVFFNDSELNKAQKEAVRFSLSANEVALIHGPPGTGKTFTCIEVIQQLVKRGDRVLVCGPSNLSVGMIISID